MWSCSVSMYKTNIISRSPEAGNRQGHVCTMPGRISFRGTGFHFHPPFSMVFRFPVIYPSFHVFVFTRKLFLLSIYIFKIFSVLPLYFGPKTYFLAFHFTVLTILVILFDSETGVDMELVKHHCKNHQ